MHQHPVFHIDQLSPWKGNEVHGREPPPPDPIVIDNDLEYEVEAILNSHKYRNQYQYLVKWKGYNNSHNSWEPAANLARSTKLVNTFHVTHPVAPRCISASIFAALPWQEQILNAISRGGGGCTKKAIGTTALMGGVM
jgi:hypothetical protein